MKLQPTFLFQRILFVATVALAVWTSSRVNGGEFLIVGIDSKIKFATEGVQKIEPGRDSVMVFEIGSDPESPKLIADLPLINSVFGPPTNLAITPDGTLALVANSVVWEKEEQAWQARPDNKVHIIDLTLPTPKAIGSVESDLQPSGMSISQDGKWAAIANRAGKSVTLYSIQGKEVTLEDSVVVDGEASAVAFTPDAKTILATKFSEHAVAVVKNVNGKLQYDPANDLPVGRWPYNIQVANRRIALVANNGNAGLPNGHVDTVSVVDMTKEPLRVIKHINVGDGPEGLAVSPDGSLAVVVLLQGSAPPFENTWFHNETGSAALLSIKGKQVTKGNRMETGRFAEGVGFNKQGTHFYVGDLLDNRITIYRVEDGTLTPTGKTVSLPGHVVSLRTQVP